MQSCLPAAARRGLATMGTALAGALFGVVFGLSPAVSAEQIEVNARYDALFAGVELGRLTIKSQSDARRYRIQSNAKVDALFGAFKFKLNAQGSGAIRGDRVIPSRYEQKAESRRKLAFKEKRRLKRAVLEFENGTVVREQVRPPRKTKKRVAIREEHRRGVLDPAAAIVALTRPVASGSPCDRRLPIFNGHQRLDLVLSPAGKGRAGGDYVCAVKYVRVAGHKPSDKEGEDLERRSNIEIVLRPVPRANLLVPVLVRVKTMAGTAEVRAARIEISGAGRKRIALIN